MKAIIFLRKIKINEAIINDKNEEILKLRSMAEKISISTDGERVSGSGVSDKIGDIMSSVADLESELRKDIKSKLEFRSKVLRIMQDSLDDGDMIEIIYKRYFQYKTWELIGTEINMSDKWIREKNSQALIRLNDKFDDLIELL